MEDHLHPSLPLGRSPLDSVPGTRPAADVRIDIPLVRRLVAVQFPQWASLAVEPVESAGWDNTIFRLGSGLAARLPRRRVSAEHVSQEHRWLPVLAPHLPLAVPVPLGHGVPGEGYPWHWTVCPWLTGELAALTRVADLGRAATSLARFIAALQAIDLPAAPSTSSAALHSPLTITTPELRLQFCRTVSMSGHCWGYGRQL